MICNRRTADWLIHVGSDLLGVLIARVADAPFEEVMAERLLAPLDMTDPHSTSRQRRSIVWPPLMSERARTAD
jgi:CubicO group peptidase (beta-lactamase class C family)